MAGLHQTPRSLLAVCCLGLVLPWLAGCEAFRLSTLGEAIGVFTAPKDDPAEGKAGGRIDPARERALVEDPALLEAHTFEALRPGSLPGGFVAFSSLPAAAGKWAVVQRGDAPVGGRALAHEGREGAHGISALLREDQLPAGPFVLRARIMIGGHGETRRAGLAINADGAAGNGHAVLLDAANNRVTMLRVRSGRLESLPNEMAGASLAAPPEPLAPGVWYELEVHTVPLPSGAVRYTVKLDGRTVHTSEDSVPSGGRSHGFTAIGDTHAFFDAVTLREKPAGPPPGEEASSREGSHTYTFDELAVGAFPPEFRVLSLGGGHGGQWSGAPGDQWSAMMIRNRREAGAGQDALHALILPEVSFADGEMTVLTRVEMGERNRHLAGVLFRYRDEGNHYRAAINTATGRVSLTAVDGGHPFPIAGASHPLRDGQWYRLGIRLDGPRIGVLVDGEEVLSAWDFTHDAGVAGLFTQCAAEAGFGEFAIEVFGTK